MNAESQEMSKRQWIISNSLVNPADKYSFTVMSHWNNLWASIHLPMQPIRPRVMLLWVTSNLTADAPVTEATIDHQRQGDHELTTNEK